MAEVTGATADAPPRRFRPYSEYRDSGVKWLGEIPAHWEVTRLRQLVGHIEQGWSPDCENREADADEWGVLKAGCVNRGAFLEFEHKALPSTLRPIPALEIRKGDLLMSRASGSRDLVGSVAVVPECRPHLLLCDKVFRLHTESTAGHRRFIAYAMNSRIVRWQIESVISGGSGLAINVAQKAVKDLVLVHPPLDERQTIGGYLDRETAKIDALVARKERLIELLQEKRAALITRAVTRGLDPNVPMKDSGVEWLGEIPAHWEVKRLKHLTPGTTVGIVVTPSKYYVDEGIPCLRSLNVSRGTIDMDNLVFISEHANEIHRKSKIFAGDVVVVRTGQAGTAAVVPTELDGANCIDLLIVRRSEQILPRYVYYYLNSRNAISQAAELSVGAIQAHYNTSTLVQLLVPRIPLDEQNRIVTHLDAATRETDRLIAKIHKATDHLREFRTALISAAVTGKIDVRATSAEASAGQGGTR